MTENQQLKNGLAELKVKYKQLFEENRVLKVEKQRLLQKNSQLLKLGSDNQLLRIERNELKNQIRSLEIKRKKKNV